MSKKEEKKDDTKGNFNIDKIIEKLLNVRSKKPGTLVELEEAEIEALCQKSRDIFIKQPMFLELEPPIKIVGDVHGQYYDLLRLFEYGGYPGTSGANYLFMGDYVDRGKQSIESICLLLAYKIKYPENFFVLRGNHECASINRIYGFYDECKRRYTPRLWKRFTDCFNCLPVSAIVADKIFSMHGGLSPELKNFDQIRKLHRPTGVPDTGLLCDLLWADPEQIVGWGESDRGVSYIFGPDVVDSFCKRFNIDLICRAHQVVEDGYEFFAGRRLVTIFSAPNYCGEFDNCGSMMSVDENLKCAFTMLKPSAGLKGRIRRLSVGSPLQSNKKKDNNKRKDPRIARKRLSIADGGGSNQSLLDGINKKDIKEEKLNNKEELDFNNIEINSNNNNKNTTFNCWTLKSVVGVVPFNPNKVNQDRGLCIESIQSQNNCSLFGVFDGHGMHGDDVSSYLIHKIPKLIEKQKSFFKDPQNGLIDLFNSTTKALKKSKVNCTFSGSTAIAVYINDKYLYGANAGDSRAILGREENGKIIAIPLSFDHKPDLPNEQKRIEKKNGRVEPCKGPLGEFIGPARVWLKHQDMPGLAMSRSFGDDVATSVGVHSIPEIIKQNRDIKNDKFIVLGSDGVWEFMSNQEVCDIVSKYNEPNKASNAVIKESSKRWQQEEEVIDDTTVIVVYF